MGLVWKVTPENQALLPVELRAELGVGPGDSVQWVRQQDGSYRIEKLARRSFDDIVGMLVASRGVADEELADAVAGARVAMERGDDALESLRGIVKPRRPVSGALIDQWSREAREGADLSDET